MESGGMEDGMVAGMVAAEAEGVANPAREGLIGGKVANVGEEEADIGGIMGGTPTSSCIFCLSSSAI
jgi:hypothetical protein